MSLLRKFNLFGSDSTKIATVNEANTARTTGTNVVVTQNIDASGKIRPAGEIVTNAPFVKVGDGTNTFSINAANTARTTGTLVLPIQNIDSTGKVSPAGDTLNNASYSKSSIVDPYGWHVKLTPLKELRTVNPIQMVGGNFEGTTLDPNFWTATTVSGSGTAVQGAGILTLATGVTANSKESLVSIRNGRFVFGRSNRYRAYVQCVPSGTINNTRRWGVFTATNGIFFELEGTSLKIVTRKNSVDIPVASASWNVSTTTPTMTNINVYEIYYIQGEVHFSINESMVHSIYVTNTLYSETLTLPIRSENYNSGGLAQNIELILIASTIHALGNADQDPTYKNITGAATTVLKYSAGRIHSIVVNGSGGTSATVYDGVSAAGIKIGTITLSVPMNIDYHTTFFVGLTIVTVGAGTDITVLYE